MSEPATVVLLVDPDAHLRALLAEQLKPLGCLIMHQADGPGAMRVVTSHDVRLVVTELYLPTGDHACLIDAIRGQRSLRKTRTVAHTHRSMTADRDWAMRAGADAYLIKPTRAERMRYVVGRLTTERTSSAATPARSSEPMVRRDSLDGALAEIERGTLTGTAAIVFGRAWWDELSPAQRTAFRRRAKSAQVSLRSDTMLGQHFVEVRARSGRELGVSTERPESPYRR